MGLRVTTRKTELAISEPQSTMPAFALANAVVDVSLSSSASSAISGSASQHIQQIPAVDNFTSAVTAVELQSQAAPKNQPYNAAPVAACPTPVVQHVNQVDSVKWGQVAAWAAGDSAQAAALMEHPGPCIAEPVASEADHDHALLRLEVQVARKKLVRHATYHAFY